MSKFMVVKRNGNKVSFDPIKIEQGLKRLGKGLNSVDVQEVIKELEKNIYDGIPTNEVEKALLLSTISFIEKDVDYDYLSARLYLQKIFKEVTENNYFVMRFWEKDIKEDIKNIGDYIQNLLY